MLTTILSWITGPAFNAVLGKAADAYKAKLEAGNTSERISADIIVRTVELEQREAELRSAERMQLPWWHPVMLIGFALAAYVLKIVVWDTMLDLGTTPAIKGDVAAWLGETLKYFVGTTAAGAAVGSVVAAFRRR